MPSHSANRWVAKRTRSSVSTKLMRPPESSTRAARNAAAEGKAGGGPPGGVGSRSIKRKMLPRGGRDLQFLGDRPGRDMEAHRAIGFRVQELVHEGVGGGDHLRGRSVAGDYALAEDIEVVGELHRLVDVVGHHHR